MAFSFEKENEVMASINITPLTDVLLVLLIIFMITAAAIQKERIKIPVTHSKEKAHETDLVISIQKNNTIYVGAKEVAVASLQPYLEKIASELPANDTGKHEDQVIIKADQEVSYGKVAEVMDAAKLAGLTNISLATQPLEEPKNKQP